MTCAASLAVDRHAVALRSTGLAPLALAAQSEAIHLMREERSACPCTLQGRPLAPQVRQCACCRCCGTARLAASSRARRPACPLAVVVAHHIHEPLCVRIPAASGTSAVPQTRHARVPRRQVANGPASRVDRSECLAQAVALVHAKAVRSTLHKPASSHSALLEARGVDARGLLGRAILYVGHRVPLEERSVPRLRSARALVLRRTVLVAAAEPGDRKQQCGPARRAHVLAPGL